MSRNKLNKYRNLKTFWHCRYLVLELCAGTLTNYCENKYNGPTLPSDALALFQIALGLDYIHSRNLVHRDVKPDNILISATTPVQMKLSDFGFCKVVSPQGTFSQSGLKGTLNWMAPELLDIMSDPDNIPNDLPRGTIESDTFAAGCVFFYLLTLGSHPFGVPAVVTGNICNGNPLLLKESKGKHCNYSATGISSSNSSFKLFSSIARKRFYAYWLCPSRRHD